MAFIGEIQIFGFGYAPPGWVLCNGLSLNIPQFSALYSLIGNSYGGDGVRQFKVPNLMGRAACGQGSGLGLTQRRMGDTFGVNTVALAMEQAPVHSHGLNFYNIAKTTDGSGQVIDNRATTPVAGYSLAIPDSKIFVKTTIDSTMRNTISPLEGGSEAHENRQPFGALAYYIMTIPAGGDGVYPTFD